MSRTTTRAQKRAACIRRRSPFSGGGQRAVDLGKLAGLGGGYTELKNQLAYSLAPNRYFLRQEAAADIFMLFRDMPERRSRIQQVIEGGGSGLGGEQLFGFEDFRRAGLAVDCNLRLPRSNSMRQTLHGWRDRRYILKTSIGLGDVCSVKAHMWQMNRAKVVVATTDNVGLPAMRLKARGHLKTPLVYVSIGLPERLQALEAVSPSRARRYRKWLSSVDLFVAYGYGEAEWLRHWFGETAQVHFIPFGVDTQKWSPHTGGDKGVDILSIGADPMRDYDLLIEYARQHPAVSICIVTGRGVTDTVRALPQNIQLKFQVPPEKLYSWIAAARMVVLPVKENSYSGATTTLLQCMAMEKPVAVSRVGAIHEGYGFSDGENLRWLEPGSEKSMRNVLDDMLVHQERSEEMGMKARQHVMDHLSWSQYVKNLSECLELWIGKGEAT